MSDYQELIPEGYFEAVAVPLATEDDPVPRYARLNWSKEGEKRRVLMSFQILSGEYAGRRLFWNGYFTKDAGKRTTEALRAVGFKGDDLMELETQTLDQIVSVKVEASEWEGKTSNRIAFVNKPGGGGAATIKVAKPLSMDEKRKFAAMMKASVAGIPEVAGERHAVAPPAATPEGNNPFDVGPSSKNNDPIPF